MSESEPRKTEAGDDRRKTPVLWRYVVPGVVVLVLTGFFYVALHIDPTYIESPLVGQKAPEFRLPGLFDPTEEVGTVDMAGQYSLLNVWATWCQECRYEHAFLVELADAGMPIYGLNWKDDREAALQWLDRLGNPYVAVAVDDTSAVAIDYGVYAAPETFLLGPDLTILHKHFGVLEPEDWESDFLPAIEAHRGGG
jgi:cytochrome c biogenesis protein CcmG/thiol:disulfide interchange protein DsbE